MLRVALPVQVATISLLGEFLPIALLFAGERFLLITYKPTSQLQICARVNPKMLIDTRPVDLSYLPAGRSNES
jgi:hypothetical protein